MSAIAQLVADISSVPAPVVFLDSCAILDIARGPKRAQPDSLAAAIELIRLGSQSPPTLYMLVADIVPAEWENHIDSAVNDAASAITICQHVLQVATHTNLQIQVTGLQELTKLPPDLRAGSEKLVPSSRIIDREQRATNLAFDRVVTKRRPSHKNEVKDSYILEHCLAVARSLGGAGFAHWLLFVSSNTRDFARPESDDVHPDLAEDFAAVGMHYAVTVSSAVAKLRAAGQIP